MNEVLIYDGEAQLAHQRPTSTEAHVRELGDEARRILARGIMGMDDTFWSRLAYSAAEEKIRTGKS